MEQAKLDRPQGESSEGKLVSAIKRGAIESTGLLLQRTQEVMGLSLEPEALSALRRISSELDDKPIEFLSHLLPDQSSSGQDIPRAVLSTVHSQKGEEFDTVLVIGLETGNMPLVAPIRQQQFVEWRRGVQGLSHTTWRAKRSRRDLDRIYEDEEERIFYVAMTRARFNLLLFTAAGREHRSLRKSEFLTKAHVSAGVTVLSNTSEISLVQPLAYDAETLGADRYRPDGRIYVTNSGAVVRSKSEMLLANELSRLGMYFEYEATIAGVSNVLPDFIFPDYGGIVLEHLGLLDDEQYAKRWEIKKQKYAKQGVRCFETTENDIRNLPETVQRLRAQFMEWTTEKYGPHRAKMIELLETVRRNSSIVIGHSVGEFDSGFFEVEGDTNVLGVFIRPDLDDSNPPGKSIVPPGFADARWIRLSIPGVNAWLAEAPAK